MTIFTQFEPSKILQSDNGLEFVATVITELKHIWTDLLIIHGRPRHPRSQGCIERANGDLEIKLGKWIQDNQKGWSPLSCVWYEYLSLILLPKHPERYDLNTHI